jgi:hypothetical protein
MKSFTYIFSVAKEVISKFLLTFYQQWIIRDSSASMAELRTIFALLGSIKFEEKWRSSAPFVRSSIRLLQQTEFINILFDSFNSVRF